MDRTGAAPLRPDDPPRIGPYLVAGRLGEGGMGTVYLARDPAGRPVAVKVVKPSFTLDEGFAARFHAEVANARRVASFCTARVLDNGDADDGRPYLVTEYIAGTPLSRQITRHGALEPGTLHGVALGVAAALAAIHVAGLVHRDLKPANVILSISGPRVIDFGISRALDATQGMTRSGELLGTPGWWAPEQVRGEEITPAADVFAWGCLVAYAGNGRHPFGHGDLMTMAARVLHGRPDLGALPAPLDRLARLATEPDPARRPTAQELLIALVGGEVTLPGPAAEPAGPPALDATALLEQAWEPPANVAAAIPDPPTPTGPPPGLPAAVPAPGPGPAATTPTPAPGPPGPDPAGTVPGPDPGAALTVPGGGPGEPATVVEPAAGTSSAIPAMSGTPARRPAGRRRWPLVLLLLAVLAAAGGLLAVTFADRSGTVRDSGGPGGAPDPGATAPGFARVTGPADCSAAGPNDFDGDGRDDVAIGAPRATAAGGAGAGTVFIRPLDAEGGPGLAIAAPDGRRGDGFGRTVRAAHLDADGCLDLIIGAPYAASGGRSAAGAVYLVRGGPYRGTVPPSAVTRLSAPAPEQDAHFGWSVAAVRSPGAGESLIAVGAPHEDADRTADSGAVYTFRMSTPGEPLPARRITQESPGVTGNGEQGDMFGWSLVFGRLGGRAGDPDLVIGAPYENDDGAGRQRGDAGIADAGAVEVVYDAASATGPYRTTKFGPPAPAGTVSQAQGARFGHALAYAEYQGEVFLAVSAPATEGTAAGTGLIQIFRRGPDGRLAPDRTIRDTGRGTGLGWSLDMTAGGDTLYLAAGSPFDGRARTGSVREFPLAGNGGERTYRSATARPWDLLGWSLAATGAPQPYAPGTGLVAGLPGGDPDGGTGGRPDDGGVALLLRDGAPVRPLEPGGDGAPGGDAGGRFGTATAG
ncbi:protein kinase domain-containing protein [Sphaerisporangium rufum]|nr:protein kinase [Sphaerisporangium rufum]